VFLGSEDAGWVTGERMTVAGGFVKATRSGVPSFAGRPISH
jgi:hypothetical protein